MCNTARPCASVNLWPSVSEGGDADGRRPPPGAEDAALSREPGGLQGRVGRF